MTCSSARNVVVEEMEALLRFIEEENSNYEKERNELKSQFHSRPQEERNIVKDILVMHSEFDSGVTKIKEIVEELSQIPTDKSTKTTKAEDLASQIVIMQASLVRKHDILQKFLVQKIKYQRLCEEANSKSLQINAENEELRFKCSEIENFENSGIFSKKLKFLNSEISRLTSILSYSGNPASLEQAPSELWDETVSGLTEKEATFKTNKLITENKRLQEEILSFDQRYLTREQYLKLKKELDSKQRRIDDLQRKLNITGEEPSNSRPEAVGTIKVLDSIAGRKGNYLKPENKSPRSGALRNSTLLQDIEASLSRVRAIASPVPKNQ